MRKILAGMTALVFALGVSVAPASALTIDGVMDESEVTVSIMKTLSALLTSTQNGNITNNATAVSTSGSNTITSSDDMEDVSLDTGSTDSALLVTNSSNDADLTNEVESSDSMDADISDVDDESTVDLEVEEDETLETEADQDFDVDNSVVTVSDSGNNTLDSGDDLEGLDVTTGDGTSALAIENIFNLLSIIQSRTIR
jgi:hypothetical protein